MKQHIGTVFLAAAALGVPAIADEGAPLPHVARAATPAETALNALAIAELRVDDNNCLRHGDAVVIWHHDTVMERAEDGRIRIIDGFNGKSVYVGEIVAMAGGGGSAISSWAGINIRQPSPPDNCTGRLWSGGPVSTAEETQAMLEEWANRRAVPPPPSQTWRKTVSE